MDPYTAASAVLVFPTGGAYAWVGWKLSLRPVSQRGQLAQHQFTLWWYGLALLTALGGLSSVLAGLGLWNLSLVWLDIDVGILLLTIVLWGLVGYLIFLYTGKYHLWPLTLFYIVDYLVIQYYVISEMPVGYTVAYGKVVTTYAATASAPLTVLAGVLLLAPELIAILAYLSLIMQVESRELRFRISVVGVSLLGWWGLALLPDFGGPNGGVWQLVSPLLGTLPAIAIVLGYFPPSWLRTRLRLQNISPALQGRAEGIVKQHDTGAKPSPERM